MLIEGTTCEDNAVIYAKVLVGLGHYVDVRSLEPEDYESGIKLDPTLDIRSYVERECGTADSPSIWKHTQGVNIPIKRTPEIITGLIELCITRSDLLTVNTEVIDTLIGKLQELRNA